MLHQPKRIVSPLIRARALTASPSLWGRLFSTTIPITVPRKLPEFEWGDLVEFSDFGSIFTLGIVTKVIPVSRQNSHIEVLQEDGGFRQVDSFFVKFSTPFMRKPSLKEGFDSFEVSKKITTFQGEARTLLHESFNALEGAVEEERKRCLKNSIIGYESLLYEADIAKKVFGDSPSPKELYTVHLYLHSYSEKFGRDSYYQIGHKIKGDSRNNVAASGPYFFRTLEDQRVVTRVKSLLENEDETCGRFRKLLKNILNSPPKVEFFKELQGQDFQDFLTILKKAVTCNWQDFSPNPFVELIERLCTGIAPTRTLNEVVALYRKLGLEGEIYNLDLPKLQSGLTFDKAQSSSEQFQKHHLDNNHSPDKGMDDLMKSLEGRVEFSDLALAIDSESTFEVDDAISIQKINGKVWLHIHVADPGRFISMDSPIDLKARSNTSTIYFPQNHYLMLPLEDSLKASLNPNRPYNGTVTFSAHLASNGDILDYQVNLGVLTRLKRITYEHGDSLFLVDPPPSPLNNDAAVEFSILNQVNQLVRKHREFRINRGALEFSLPQGKVTFDRSSRRRGRGSSMLKFTLEETGNSPSHLLIAECMIIAGRVAALFAQDKNIPSPFRYHNSPLLIEKEGEGKDSLEALKSIQNFGKDAPLFDRLKFLSLLSPSAIDIVPRKHWSMGLESYIKATSPLRRYFDLLFHHQIHQTFNGRKLQTESIDEISKIIPPVYRHEQYLKRLQNSSQRYWTVRYISQLLQTKGGLSGDDDDYDGVDDGEEDDGNWWWSPIQVTVIPLSYDTFKGSNFVYIQDFAISQFCKIPGGSALSVGVPIKLNIISVDIMRSTIQLARA